MKTLKIATVEGVTILTEMGQFPQIRYRISPTHADLSAAMRQFVSDNVTVDWNGPDLVLSIDDSEELAAAKEKIASLESELAAVRVSASDAESEMQDMDGVVEAAIEWRSRMFAFQLTGADESLVKAVRVYLGEE